MLKFVKLLLAGSRKDAKLAKAEPRISRIDTDFWNLTTDNEQQTTDCPSEERKDSCKSVWYVEKERDNFVGLWKFCTFAFVNWNQIKKGGNGKQKDYYKDLENYKDR